MALINIPYVAQPKKSPKCGVACLAMLIKYYSKQKVDLDEIWSNVRDISPELSREYCKTYKLGAYLNSIGIKCSIVRYTDLSEFLSLCLDNEIAPVVNHLSFENKIGGHFSVVKNFVDSRVILNDPENRKRNSVSLKELDTSATKTANKDQEIGGNTALVVTEHLSVSTSRHCPNCGSPIDTSFSELANSNGKVISAELCLSCDSFSLSEST